MCDYLEVSIFMTQNNMLPAYTKVSQAKLIFTSRLSPVLIYMGDYPEVNIFMTQNNMLPAYTKVNQAKLIFIFTSRLSPYCSMMYLV